MADIHSYIHTFIHLCIYAFMHLCIYTYIHTYIHTWGQGRLVTHVCTQMQTQTVTADWSRVRTGVPPRISPACSLILFPMTYGTRCCLNHCSVCAGHHQRAQTRVPCVYHAYTRVSYLCVQHTYIHTDAYIMRVAQNTHARPHAHARTHAQSRTDTHTHTHTHIPTHTRAPNNA